MTEPADDTPQTPPEPRPERERKPGGYYYDDGTGYELYQPAPDEDEREDNESSDT